MMNNSDRSLKFTWSRKPRITATLLTKWRQLHWTVTGISSEAQIRPKSWRVKPVKLNCFDYYRNEALRNSKLWRLRVNIDFNYDNFQVKKTHKKQFNFSHDNRLTYLATPTLESQEASAAHLPVRDEDAFQGYQMIHSFTSVMVCARFDSQIYVVAGGVPDLRKTMQNGLYRIIFQLPTKRACFPEFQ